MSDLERSYPSIEQVGTWLAKYHNAEISDLNSLTGGFWSSAFSYRVAAKDFVLRLSDMADGFAIDRAAMRFRSRNLPVPNVVDTGRALGFHFAIAERHFGRFVETTAADEGQAVGHALASLLVALRAVPTTRDDGVIWYDQEQSVNMTWRAWLNNALVDNPALRVSGWRARLAEQPRLDRLFEASKLRFEQLLPACPERRDLIHGDLLHKNVLVSEDASTVTAVFSWKCSALGDFLYDVAWCTFWSPWHPGIAAADLWKCTLQATDLSESDLVNASLRHHCYELQIGASHLGWNAWTGNDRELEAVATALQRTLDQGPHPYHQPDSVGD